MPHSEPYISDGSAESDEDVLANCDLERDERNDREENPHATSIAGGEHDRGQDHETVDVDGEETEEERERRLREEASRISGKSVRSFLP